MMNNTVGKIERIHGDLKQIVDGLPDENEIAKYYGKDALSLIDIMIRRLSDE
ncbi:hypothetical protein QMA60_06255 [Leuconostoc suionicum]|uniref:hypothetical protein n=1 Tax=Leuconostoc suionicum TaxID=1511761 RepID=UPI0024AD0EE3|nr:hypothetical protein [Leuconostoc suionicum]MDI6497918.1 hypothetical protein [Leuconostoc suionicum]MDI6499999.1 hypothetical protein [Leuconostoc suionicum]MDI6502344.1 hypothetical protein [Leuconostoc suionicum]MDI6613977.1 hypothetical protein [Leuconostoc suionicum]MDI6665220.1 hypothetical protein [Leuconostoc suionicum]